MTNHRIYRITDNGNTVALVSATSQAAAIRHCLRDRFGAEIAKPQELADLITAGMRVQMARSPELDIVGEAS